MKTTADYLNDLQTATGTTSDYSLAPIMGWKKQQISGYRTRKTAFSDETAIRVAGVLNIDAADVIIAMRVQVAKGQDVRGVWERIAQRVAAGLLIAAGIGIAPPPASATTLHNQISGAQNIHYARTGRRKKTANSAISAMTATLAASLGLHTLAP